jgi:hypothetical protein
LQDLDPVNFDKDYIQKYYNDTIQWTFELFEKTVHDDDNAVVLNDYATVDRRIVQDVRNNIQDDNEVDDDELELYQLVRRRVRSERQVMTQSLETVERKRKELRIKIQNSMEEYKETCSKMDMLAYLEDNGNEEYKKMKKSNKLDYKKIIEFEDAVYVSKFFDVTKWWKEHEQKYPELALAANIILGKPTHNAFQERVFSRGTYADTKLRKNLKEEFFEMSVLNAVNSTMINEMFDIMQPMMDKSIELEKENIKGKEEIKEYLNKRMVEVDLTNIPDISTLNIVEDEYGSITSQCTDDLSSVGDCDDDSSINNDLMDFIDYDDKETDGKIKSV